MAVFFPYFGILLFFLSIAACKVHHSLRNQDGSAQVRGKREPYVKPVAQSFWFGALVNDVKVTQEKAEKFEELLKSFSKQLKLLKIEGTILEKKRFEYTHDHNRGCCANQITHKGQLEVDRLYFDPVNWFFINTYCGTILSSHKILNHEIKAHPVAFPADYYCVGPKDDPEKEAHDVAVEFCKERYYSKDTCEAISDDGKKQVQEILESEEYKKDRKSYCFHLIGEENLPEHVHESIPNYKAHIPGNYYCVGGHGDGHHQALEVMRHYCTDIFFHGKKNCSISYEAEIRLLHLFETELFLKNVKEACRLVLPADFLEKHKVELRDDLTFEIDKYCPLNHDDVDEEADEVLALYCKEKIYSV